VIDRDLFITTDQVRELRAATIGRCTFCQGAGRIKRVEGIELHFEACSCQNEFDRRVGLVVMHLPKKFWDFELTKETLDPGIKKHNPKALIDIWDYRENLQRALENNVGLFLQGDRGLGKSAYGVCILKEAYAKGYSAYFTTLQELIDLAFKAIRDHEIEEQLRQIVAEVDFLMLDEIDKVYLSRGGEAEALLDRVFTQRYYVDKPIIATSNTLRDTLGAVYGKTILDRFRESLIEITLKGGSIRPKLGVDLKNRLKGE
jgi:DNA replication protein DnaC